MTEPSINEDVEWLIGAHARLIAMNERYKNMVPENPRPWEPIQMAHLYSAQAIRGCERTIGYLKQAVKEAMGR